MRDQYLYNISVGLLIATIVIIFMAQTEQNMVQAYHSSFQDQFERMEDELLLQFEREMSSQRHRLIDSLFVVEGRVASEIRGRDERLHHYMIVARRIILERNSHSFSDSEITDLLIENFNLSEQYGIPPMLFLSFAYIESTFRPHVVSVAGARGLAQFMPDTALYVMSEEYFDGMEFDPIWSVRMWYRYVNYLVGDSYLPVEWLAAAYLSPAALSWYRRGGNIEDFMEWVASWSPNPVNYYDRVIDNFHFFSNLYYQSMVQESL